MIVLGLILILSIIGLRSFGNYKQISFNGFAVDECRALAIAQGAYHAMHDTYASTVADLTTDIGYSPVANVSIAMTNGAPCVIDATTWCAEIQHINGNKVYRISEAHEIVDVTP